MGAKTALLAYAEAAIADVLQDAPAPDLDQAAALLARIRPGHRLDAGNDEPWALAEALYPPEGTVCALSVPGLDLICDQEVMLGLPSQLPEHLVAAGRGRRLYLHAMHSVSDWLAFAVWDDGRLVRSLSLSPDGGIVEDIGERLPFELPYWEGRYPVEPEDEDEDDEPYPLPFHPLELGERAMLDFFGFYVEGFSDEDGAPEPVVSLWDVGLHAFRMTAPTEDEVTLARIAARD
ncbi:DUF6928 family protein [Kitasatospora sp. NPDC004615]|uniref:DUF6928 family protein n=1 Tax=Kitasatospora sp. NPDC004615 TaxID=3364017 RepID=UPI0036AFCD01